MVDYLKLIVTIFRIQIFYSSVKDVMLWTDGSKHCIHFATLKEIFLPGSQVSSCLRSLLIAHSKNVYQKIKNTDLGLRHI